jgi:hypothetical protein
MGVDGSTDIAGGEGDVGVCWWNGVQYANGATFVTGTQCTGTLTDAGCSGCSGSLWSLCTNSAVVDDYALDIVICPATDAATPADADVGAAEAVLATDAAGCMVNGVLHADGTSWEEGTGCPCVTYDAIATNAMCNHFTCSAGSVNFYDLVIACDADGSAPVSAPSADASQSIDGGQASGNGN